MATVASQVRQSVPVVDIATLAGPVTPAFRDTARELRRVFETIGFAYIAGHGVAQAQVDDVFAASRAFHALPLEAKQRLKINAAHRGYMGMSTSTIVTSSVAKVTKPNQSESLMVMHEPAPEDEGKPLQGPNQWPAELPDFRARVLAYNAALEAVARRLTRAVPRARSRRAAASARSLPSPPPLSRESESCANPVCHRAGLSGRSSSWSSGRDFPSQSP